MTTSATLPYENFGSQKPNSIGVPSTKHDGVATPEERFEELQQLCAPYMNEEELEILERAYKFADKCHNGQKRKSGEPFIIHPIEVAIILASLRMDVETIVAALLHDTVEDTDITRDDVAKEFGEPVAQLVDGVTKITRIEVESLTDEQAETIRKMFVAMSKDIRVIVIKLADRLHNMRTLSALREDRRIFKSHETLEIYAPIAHRLGINSIKWELEDLSFYFLEPQKFAQVSRMVAESRAEREAYLEKVIGILHDEIDGLGIEAQIMGRPKHLYSIYQKMSKRGKGFSEIYDLIAVRIITKSVKDCYSALGAVHSLWHPMPGRFKDYIAMPKYNMYQSLHTTVIGPYARPLEVQIRTEEMHRMSEYGVAAHWRYKENGGKSSKDDFSRQLAWLREVVDWQSTTSDSRELLKSLKVDLAPNEVFVFTRNGEVRSLRAGSNPIDFAYAIHTEVGNHCVGAKVNGAIVPLGYELQTGDQVEILTQNNARPSRDWLNVVATPSARNKIRRYFDKASRDDYLQEGRDKLRQEMRKHNIGISNAHSIRAIKDVVEKMGFKNDEDMFVKIGNGQISATTVANHLLKTLVDRGTASEDIKSTFGDSSMGKLPPMITSVKKPKKHEAHNENGIIVKGLNDVLVRLSKCCNPVPGDEIVGFVTRGRGVSVHRADCPNAKALMDHPERIINVEWENRISTNTSFKVEVLVEALDRMNLLMDVAAALSGMGANVLGVTSHVGKDGMVEMRFLLQVASTAAITRTLDALANVDGVFLARRMAAGESQSKRQKK